MNEKCWSEFVLIIIKIYMRKNRKINGVFMIFKVLGFFCFFFTSSNFYTLQHIFFGNFSESYQVEIFFKLCILPQSILFLAASNSYIWRPKRCLIIKLFHIFQYFQVFFIYLFILFFFKGEETLTMRLRRKNSQSKKRKKKKIKRHHIKMFLGRP